VAVEWKTGVLADLLTERRMKHTSRQLGFTLIEILTVCVLLGLIASFALPSYMQSRRVVFEDNAIARLQRISMAESRYYSEFGRFGDFFELTTAKFLPSGYSTTYQYRSPVSNISTLPFVDRYSLAFYIPNTPNSLYYKIDAIPVGNNQMGLRTFNINLFITGQTSPTQLVLIPPVREGIDASGLIVTDY
jgi:prepilin-type N-terminal cleavage/methylation domain-containing protein